MPLIYTDEYDKNGLEASSVIANKLNLKIFEKNSENSLDKSSLLFKNKIQDIIKNRIKEIHNVSIYDEQVIFEFKKINNDFLYIAFPKKYLLSETPIILFLWMISISLILSLVAFLFLRIQIRAIQRLAISAEEFGKGKETKTFKPSGAMEIRQAGNAFLKMRKRINNFITQRTSFLAGISHDLGTLITRIKLRLELLEKTRDIKQIKNDVNIMQSLLKEYLDFAEKINVTKVKKINLLDLINEVIESSNFEAKDVSVNCSKNSFVISDKSCLYRIIFNLFENAIKFGKIVNIKVKKEVNSYLIYIKDDGPGIPYQQRTKIFRPFYKIDDSRNLNKGGSGLGLSIADELSKKIKAKISLVTQKKRGSIFIVKIPKNLKN